jgi:threonine/homoserine/homoserine lactone efflux protein
MDIAGLIVFATALAVAAATPGPTTTALVARVLARGSAGALALMFGLAVGEVLWLTAAILGLAVLARTFAFAFVILKFAGAAYLLYLAWRIWSAPPAADSGAAPRAESRPRLFMAGLAITLGNPKVMLFYLALLPNFVDLGALTVAGYSELVATMFIVLTAVDGAYVLLAARARKLFASRRAMRLMQRTAGLTIAGAAVAVAAR